MRVNKYNHEHRDQVNEKARARRAADPQHARDIINKYHGAHRKEMVERTMQWKAAEPEKAFLLQYKRDATRRKVTWQLSDEEALHIRGQPCHYCNKQGPGGIDRTDNDKGYETGNVLPCCSQCNMAKTTMTVFEFYDMVWQVHHRVYPGLGPLAEEHSGLSDANFLRRYKRSAKAREITWTLTDEQALDLRRHPCHYCTKPGPGGIDRVDNDGTYEPQNVVACCTRCNYAKRDVRVEEFYDMVSQVYKHRVSVFDRCGC